MPLTVEQQLPVAYHRPLHLYHDFVPLAAGLAGLPEFIGDPSAADHGPALVDQQQLAVVAVQVAHAALPVQAVVPAQVHPSIEQPLAQRRGECQRAVIIEQATHAHATPGRLLQHLDHRLRAGACLDQIQLQIDLGSSFANGMQHPREELRAVDQQFELITVTPGKYRARHVNGQ